MLRDTSITYELCLNLKEHRFINHDSDEILTESQEKRIFQYLDDLTVDLFFRLSKFKPILVMPEICYKRFTPFGLKDVKKPIELDLNNPFDRYTFIKIITTPPFLEKFIESKSKNNKFARLLYDSQKYGSYSYSFLIKPQVYDNPYLDPFEYEFKAINFDNNRATHLFCYRDFIRESSYEYKYDIHCPMYFAEILSDYAAVKNEEIFPNISLEYVLSIYVILVEKLHIKYDTISSILAFALAKEFDITHPLQLFHNFELRLPYLFKRELIDERDIYLRFVNSERSKAFSFEFNKPTPYYTSIKLFNETPVVSVSAYNTLPLPYLYNKLYN